MTIEWTSLLTVALLSLGAGLAIVLGGALSFYENGRGRWMDSNIRQFIIALGGGLLQLTWHSVGRK